jgi:2-oxoacid:acceptor oxidoreductase delta subunit (pyruvate/2-ketoisovalerate family)
LSWKELKEGALIRGATSRNYVVSNWRVEKPVINKEKCTNCLICWIYCPEPAIVRLGDGVAIDYDHCKGCGICESECPPKAITMVKET